jgi:hypothetical protein
LTEITSILLGDNPFFGVDHLSQERAREKACKSQDFHNIIEVIEYSVNAGADGLVVSTHPKLRFLIDSVIKIKPNLISKISLFPILPYTQGYVLNINEKGMIKTIMDILNPASSFQNKIRILTKGSLGVIRKDLFDLLKVFIDVELLPLHNTNMKTVFLHDVLTDLALSLNLRSVFETFQQHLHDTYGIKAGLVTKNFARLVAKLQEWDLQYPVIMTSFNKIGFQMNPSKQACEDCLLNYDGELIAMSVLAGGYLGLKEAHEYILSQPKIRTVVIGASSVGHVKNTFELFLNRKVI